MFLFKTCVLFLVFFILAMVLSARGICYGCSTSFLQLVSLVLTPAEMENGPSHRQSDFAELFAGKANLSNALRAVSQLQCNSVMHCRSQKMLSMTEAGFSGHSYDKVNHPSQNIHSHEGKLQCLPAAYYKSQLMFQALQEG